MAKSKGFVCLEYVRREAKATLLKQKGKGFGEKSKRMLKIANGRVYLAEL